MPLIFLSHLSSLEISPFILSTFAGPVIEASVSQKIFHSLRHFSHPMKFFSHPMKFFSHPMRFFSPPMSFFETSMGLKNM
jgi:hypothetical protein